MSSVGLNIHQGILHAGEAVTHAVKSVVTSENLTLGIKMTNLVRHIGSTSKSLLNNTSKLPAVGALKLVNLGLAPLTIYGIGASFFSSIKATLNERVDAFLSVISSLGSLLDIAATTAEGLAAVGAVALKAVKWATPVAIVAAAVEGVGLFLTTKKIIETHRFSKIFNQAAALHKSVEDYNLEDFRKARQLIEVKQSVEKSFVGKHFKIDSGKLVDRLRAIEKEATDKIRSQDPIKILEGKRQLQNAMQALSKRTVTNRLQGALSILSGVVGIIGVGLLFCPFPPAGFILMAISGVLSITNLLIEKGLNHRLEKQLGMK